MCLKFVAKTTLTETMPNNVTESSQIGRRRDISVMLLRAGIYRRHHQSVLRKRKLFIGDSTMTDHNFGLDRRKVLDIRIGRLVDAHMAVADLQRDKALLLRGHCLDYDTKRGRHTGRPLQGWVQS